MPRRTDISSILLIGAAAALLASFEASAQSSVRNAGVGKLAVTREHYVREGTPILHAPGEWKKIRLEWVSTDRRVRFFLEDDGFELRSNYQVRDDHLNQDVCLGGGYPQAYQTRVPAERRWRRSLRSQFGRLLRHCEGWLDEARRNAYLEEFAEAAGDFAGALALMKEAAIEDFGGWQRRCLRTRIDRSVMPFPAIRCLRYSTEAH